jgi:glycosyltransferase involved in cell wall biosynthesis
MILQQPKLLILTSSFPASAADETCGYLREFARSLAKEFAVQVLTLADAQAARASQASALINDAHRDDWQGDDFKLTRSKSFLPQSLDPLQSSKDLNGLMNGRVWTKLLALISLAAFFIRAVKLARQSDVICSHWLLPSGFFGAILARLLNKPHIVVEHSGALHLLLRMPCGKLLARFIVSHSEKIVTVSNDLKRKLVAFCPEAKDKIEVIAMGVNALSEDDRQQNREDDRRPLSERLKLSVRDEDKFAKAERKSVARILFIGRLVEIKGVSVLLKALTTLPDVQLLVAGDGERRNEFQAMAKKLNVDAVFFGFVGEKEKAELFAMCEAMAIPSLILPDGRTEGMPVVALEAFAASLPVIASRVGGLSEIIIDGQNGLLFDAGNDAQLAEKIRLLLDDQQLQRELADNAKRTADSFDWQIIGAKFRRMIKDSLSTNGAIESYQTTPNLKY